jgi:hypothetical protein
MTPFPFDESKPICPIPSKVAIKEKDQVQIGKQLYKPKQLGISTHTTIPCEQHRSKLLGFIFNSRRIFFIFCMLYHNERTR